MERVSILLRRTALGVLVTAALAACLATTSFAHGGAAATLTLTPAEARPGDSAQVTGLDFAAGVDVVVELMAPSGRTLTTARTDAEGSFARSVVIPLDVSPGDWPLRARSEAGDDVTLTARVMGASAGAPSQGATAADEHLLPVALAVGAMVMVGVLALAFVLGAFHDLAARVHRVRVRRAMDGSSDQLFTRRRRFAWRRPAELPPVDREHPA